MSIIISKLQRSFSLGAILIVLLTQGLAHAQPTARPDAKPLWPGEAPLATGQSPADQPTITSFLPATNPTHTAVIVAPGGGYEHLATDKEGDQVARWLNARGVAAFVLKYRLGPSYRHPVELGDAQRAIRTVRAQAASLGISPDHIGMWGFSAGGHLTATAGTLYNQPATPPQDAIDRQSARPDFLILAYPVIAMDQPYGHTGSIRNLLGPDPDPALVALLSPQLHVTAETPPTFLFATTDDATVPVMNSVLFYSALVAAKVPVEMHLYEHGPHGVGLAASFPALQGWPDLLATWMRNHGLMSAEP